MPLLPAKALLAELARRREEAASAARGKAKRLTFLDGLHPKQLAFVKDPSRRKAALAGRRGGKSRGVGAWLVEGGESDPGGLSVYVARSKGNARLIIWPALEEMSAAYELGLRLREVDNQLMVYMPNGHRIWLAGAKDRSEVGKFRGPKYRRVAIDEAQEYGGYLRELIVEVFEPALGDKMGELALTGTPSPVPAGMFYEVTTGDGGQKWPTHEWTVLDNPYLRGKEMLADYLAAYGIDQSHPSFQREWLAKWVRDDGSLVYPYDGAKNAWDGQLIEGAEYVWVLGIDVGVVDETAFVVACARRGHPEVYIVEAWKREGLIPSAVAAQVARLQKEYPIARTVVDEGGIGKGYAEEMRRSYGLACEPAEKTHKRTYQEMTSGDLRSGVIRVNPWKCRDLIDEIQILQWTPDKIAEDERFANHCADAFLYAVRALRPWYRPEREPPKPGSREALELEAAKIREEARRRARERSREHYGLAA